MSATTNLKHRRPKPVNYDKRRTLRFGAQEDAAVEHMREALARNRGVKPGDVDYSEAHRLLLVENHKSAMELAGRPETWPRSTTVELPDELWEQLTECRNALVHSRGSMYGILRKVNGVDKAPFTRDESREALEAIEESKTVIAQLEARLVEFVSQESAVADAKADGPRA